MNAESEDPFRHAVPGCISEGDTVEEAIANIKESVAIFVESLPAERLQR